MRSGADYLRLHRPLRPAAHRNGRRGRRGNPQPGVQHGSVLGADAHRQLRHGQDAPHAPVRNDQRAVRPHIRRHPQARHAEPGGGEGDDRPRVRGDTRAYGGGRRGFAHDSVAAAPAGVLHDFGRRRRGDYRVQRGRRQLRQAARVDNRRRRGDEVPRERRRHNRERGGAVGAARVRRRRRVAGRNRRPHGLRFVLHNRHVHDRRPRLLREGRGRRVCGAGASDV